LSPAADYERRAVKVVIHAHTNHSYDSNTEPAELIATARRQGVDCVAVTDHDEIAGALAAREIGRGVGVRVIIGEEVSTADGHLIGLFLHEWVRPGQPAEETARQIREQGGLVLAPHPFSTLCDDSLGGGALERLVPWLDAVEVCNAQNPLPWQDARAARFARRHRLPGYAGSDTHLRGWLDAAHQVLAEWRSPGEFRAALRAAEVHPGRFGPTYFAQMVLRHIWDKFARQPLPGFGDRVAGRRDISIRAATLRERLS
jgi:predicted metal-dependent phosphoesterase TrpH